ncbi:MAG: calcium-binding protein [Pseudomonadota bacterium]
MTQFITVSGGAGTSVGLSLSAGEDAVLANEVQIFADAAEALTGAGDNVVVLGTGAALVSFADDAVDLVGGGDSLLDIGDEALILASQGAGVFSAGDLSIRNAGVVNAADGAVIVSGTADIVNFGTITGGAASQGVLLNHGGRLANFGDIVGDDAVMLDTRGASIRNSGRIDGALSGVHLRDAGTNTTTLLNSGEIASELIGVKAVASLLQTVNSGLIVGGRIGIDAGTPGSGAGVNTLANTGTVSGDERSYDGSDVADEIENAGLMIGDIRLDDGDDRYIGRAGEVEGTVEGGAGADVLVGGAAADAFLGGAQDDALRGRGGDDSLSGDEGNDLLVGGAGDDALDGGADDDALRGKAGDDALSGGDGLDDLRGHAGDDELFGGAGGDELRGHGGDDVLGGGRGADLLIGGRGDDVMTGGQFIDTFVFNRRAGEDEITDFENGTDVIDLQAFGLFAGQFNSVVAPALSSAGGGATFLDLDAMGGTGSVLIKGLAFADADASDFIL